MSLTSLSKTSDFRQTCDKHFISPPKIKMVGLGGIMPLTTEYALTGMAFSYLYRLLLMQSRNDFVAGEFVAEMSNAPEVHSFQEKLQKVKSLSMQELAQLALIAALLDKDARTGVIAFPQLTSGKAIHMGKIIDDLLAMSAPLLSRKASKSKVLMNYHFGSVGRVVGGADNAVIVGSTVVRTSTSKYAHLHPDLWYQMLGYWALHNSQSGVWVDRKRYDIELDSFVIYFARYQQSLRFAIKDIALKDMFHPQYKNILGVGA